MNTDRLLGVGMVVLTLASAAPARAQMILQTNVIFGSSVAEGANACGHSFCQQSINGSFVNSYGALLTQTMATDGWWVVNRSDAGDDTQDAIGRFFRDVPARVDEVFIALSLGNEGLDGSPNPQAVSAQFYSGISNLVAMTYQNGSLPVLGGVYPKDDFSATEYSYLKNMVLQFNALGVPHVNFLGATDNGYGHWVYSLESGPGFDGTHPNAAGHYEMFLAIVPSVFDALKAGKPTPQWGNRSRYVHVVGDPSQPAPLSFSPGSTVHSFSMSFRVRTSATGTVASVTVPGDWQPTIQITPTDLVYVASYGQVVGSGVTATDGAWHEVVLAHGYALGQTLFYVDGALAGTAYEQLAPVSFALGGPGSATTQPGSPIQADYQDWFIHRGMLDAEEVTAQHQGSLQQESLEVYSPLDDPSFLQGGTVTNRAQSLSVATVNGAMLSAPLTAGFFASPTNGPAPLVVTFTDASIGAITNWYWDFGDGGTTNTTVNSIVHTYNPGTYTVTLIASGAVGVSTNIQPGFITAAPWASTIAVDAGYLYDNLANPAAANSVAVLVADTGTNGFIAPEPGFALSPGAMWGTENQIVGLWDLSGCGCGDGVLLDQTVLATTNGIAPGQSLQLYWFPSLTLASNAVGLTYYGSYTDTNSPALDGSDSWVIPAKGSNAYLNFWTMSYGGSNPESAGQATNLASVPLLAGFTASPSQGLAPLAVTFTDTSTGPITNRFWSFGDGTTTNTIAVSLLHTYQFPGTDTVSLIVSGVGGVSTDVQYHLIIATPVGVVDDGIPDWWRAQYFPNMPNNNTNGMLTNSFSCSTCDADGTGQNNLFKYVAGLDPTNPASVFVLTIAGLPDEPEWTSLSFNPIAQGHTYTPQFTTDLLHGAWSPLATYTGLCTNGNQVTVTDTNPIPPQELYRIDISLP